MMPAEELSQLDYIPTIPQFVDWLSQKWADRPAVNDTVNSYTYSQFAERIARRRALYDELGLQKGDKIAIFERTSIDAIESFLAVTTAGCVAVMLPSQLPAPALVGCCMKFDVKLLIVRDEFKEIAAGVKCQTISASSMAENGIPATEVDKEDAAAIFFTGGTTGAPKGAILSHRAIMRGAFNGIFAPGPQLFGHRVICLMPLNHVFGLIRSTLGVFYVGGEWYSAEDTKATLSKIPMIRPTMLVLVPGLCEILAGLAKMYGPQFFGGELKMMISGAANVPPLLIKTYEEFGIKLLFGYGMTEAANLTTANIDIDTRPTSIGKVYPGQELKVVDGELWIKGDNLFSGYYGEPELTKAAFSEDGWLKTGDLARIDEEGYVYIVGRIKNLIILSNGENISPESLEEPFYAYDVIRDALVKEENNSIVIEILPRMSALEGKTPEEIESIMRKIVDEVNESLPTTHRISKFYVRKEDFKRTGAMKVSRI